MTVEDEAAALLAEYRPQASCKIKDSGHAALVDALSVKGAGSRTIERILTERLSFRVSFNTILRHTRRNCGCP